VKPDDIYRLNAYDHFMSEHAHSHAHGDHDHDHPVTPEAIAAAAEAACAAKGLKLTDQRRDVLIALAEAGKPLGAYDILSTLTMKGHKKLAPVSIYRALDFLLEAGLVHRLESRNAFILCPHQHGQHDMVTFLICQQCGRVEEAMSEAVGAELADIARRHHFQLSGHVIEMKGRCAACTSGPLVA
jgi:Fur family transcriptional regulator, zinc uptake regulator